MLRWDRIVLLATLVAVAPALAGCESFDPDSLDIFHLNDKKKLPGDRKPLFPGGVPGVTQGIPPEYMKGNVAQPDAAAVLPPNDNSANLNSAPPPQAGEAPAAVARQSKTASVEPVNIVPAEEAKAKPKPKAKAKAKKKPPHKPTFVSIQPAKKPSSDQQQQPQQQPQQQTGAWPSPGQSTNGSPWPSAPPASQ